MIRLGDGWERLVVVKLLRTYPSAQQLLRSAQATSEGANGLGHTHRRHRPHVTWWRADWAYLLGPDGRVAGYALPASCGRQCAGAVRPLRLAARFRQPWLRDSAALHPTAV